jgi:hypothetical protein
VDSSAMASAQIVIDDDLMPLPDQLIDDMAADIAGTAGDQDFHSVASLLR